MAQLQGQIDKAKIELSSAEEKIAELEAKLAEQNNTTDVNTNKSEDKEKQEAVVGGVRRLSSGRYRAVARGRRTGGGTRLYGVGQQESGGHCGPCDPTGQGQGQRCRDRRYRRSSGCR